MSYRQLFSIGLGLVAYITAAIGSAAEQNKQPEAVKIPLKDIWAADMPGTRDVYELEKGTGSRNHPAPLSDDIADALPFLSQGKTTGKGFAVVGTEKEALRSAAAILAKKQQPRQSFSTKANIWVVFFSHSFGQYVHLTSVERRDKIIKVGYRFVPHETKQLTAHYALIPLGKLPVGKYRVDIVRLPLEQKYVDQGFKSVDSELHNRVVCQPFSFEIVK